MWFFRMSGASLIKYCCEAADFFDAKVDRLEKNSLKIRLIAVKHVI